MAKIKGRGVVRNAEGTVTVVGQAQVNTTQSAELVDASEVQKLKAADGKTKTLISDEDVKKVTVEIIPGGQDADSATLAQALAQAVLPTKLGNLVLSGFSITAFNDTYVVEEDSPIKITANGNCIITVKGTKYEKDFSGAVLSA